MGKTKLDIKKATSPRWLKENDCTLILPKNQVHKVRMVQILWGNIIADSVADRIKLLLSVVDGLSKRSLQVYKKHNFRFNNNTIGKKIFSNKSLLDKYKNDTFIVEVFDQVTEMIKYHFQLQMNKPQDIQIKEETPILDPAKIAKIRDVEITKPEAHEVENEVEKENIAMRICELTATGITSIQEACQRFNVRYSDFAGWVIENDYIKQMFVESTVMRKFFKASEQDSRLDKMIDEILSTGFLSSKSISSMKIRNALFPEGVWIEDKKTEQIKQVELKDLIALKQFNKDVVIPQLSHDEFGSLSDEQVMEKMNTLKHKFNKAINKGINDLEGK